MFICGQYAEVFSNELNLEAGSCNGKHFKYLLFPSPCSFVPSLYVMWSFSIPYTALRGTLLYFYFSLNVKPSLIRPQVSVETNLKPKWINQETNPKLGLSTARLKQKTPDRKWSVSNQISIIYHVITTPSDRPPCVSTNHTRKEC